MAMTLPECKKSGAMDAERGREGLKNLENATTHALKIADRVKVKNLINQAEVICERPLSVLPTNLV